jgi:GTPase
MGRLIRLDRTGHSTVAEWSGTDGDGSAATAAAAFREELERGMVASVSYADGTAEVVRELPLEAELVVLRRPIAGG